jgi:hypothetical protein
MPQVNVNQILQEVSTLSIEDQDFIMQTISKRLQELRRMQIAERAKEAEENYRCGNVQSGTVSDLMRSLNND